MFKCRGCREMLPPTAFHRSTKPSRPVYSYCKPCRAQKDADHHQRYRAIVMSSKAVPCQECQQIFPAVCMDFDHVRGVKRFEISEGGSRCLRTLREEIAKCEIVCANCHRVRTARRAGYDHGDPPSA